MTAKEKYIPLKPEVKSRKARFAELNDYVRSRNGWITSIPGVVAVEMQCLPGSTLPDDLRGLGYDVTETGETERILPTAITEQLCLGADGALEPMTAGSTRPVAMTTTHAGIVKVK